MAPETDTPRRGRRTFRVLILASTLGAAVGVGLLAGTLWFSEPYAASAEEEFVLFSDVLRVHLLGEVTGFGNLHEVERIAEIRRSADFNPGSEYQRRQDADVRHLAAVKLVVLEATTATVGPSEFFDPAGQVYDGLRDVLGGQVSRQMLEELVRRNAGSVPISGEFRLRVPVHLFTPEDEHRCVGSDGRWSWEVFRALFPDSTGRIALSRPAFDHSGGHALLTMSVCWDSLAAIGYLVLMERREDGWHVAEAVQLWVS